MNNMFKAVVFDADGMMIKNSVWFSKRLAKQYGVKEELILPFFQNEFQQCLVGQADLKEELAKYIPIWGWPGTIDELLEFWFSGEAEVDESIVGVIQDLKQKGINCYLATNNEKYRTEYMAEKLGFSKLFAKIFSSAYIGLKKPQLEFYQYIIDDLKLSKDEVLFWDDEADKLEEVKKHQFIIEKYTDFESFKDKMTTFGLL